MIKLQNGSYHMGDHGDRQAVMDLLVAFTKEKGHEVTRQEVLDTPTMPHPNTIGSYVDGGFDAAVKKAHVLAFPKEDKTPTPPAKTPEKKERTPLTREEIIDKVAKACFQHGDNTGWINDISLRSVVPIADVYKAFKQGGVKELRNAVKAALWEQKHPNKPPKTPQPLVQTVVLPDEVLKSVTTKEEPELLQEEKRPEIVQETEAVQLSEPTKEPPQEEEYAEADDFYSVEDIEGYEEAPEEPTEEEEPAEPIGEEEPEETPEPEKVEEPTEEATPEEVIDVAKDKEEKKRLIDTSKMTDQEIADMYYKVCKEKGYIINQRESLEYSKHHPFPSWSTLVNRLGNWWTWGSRFNLPYKDEKANEKARQYMEEQGRQKDMPEPDEPSLPEKDDVPGPGPSLPDKEPESDTTIAPEPDNNPAPGPSLPTSGPSNREFVYPIKITLPEGMSGTISFHMDLDVTIKI